MRLPKLLIAFLVLCPPLLADDAPKEIPLWPNGAPGSEGRRGEAELAKDYWVRNIHNPSITVYLPKEKANGTAVVICPGGGHRELVFNAEGAEPARFLNSLGVAAFALKYRLAREAGSPYKIEDHAREDAKRAMRLVRRRAAEWNVDPRRVGMMGFSAGGEVLSMVAFGPSAGDSAAPDPIDRLSSRPDFALFIYPGPLGVPGMLPADAPPAFLLVADDDETGAAGVITTLLERYREAHVPVEAHVFAHGRHAFNMGNRSSLVSIKAWPQRMADWLADSGLLSQTPSDKP